MRIISNKLLALAATGLAASASAADLPVTASACPDHLSDLAPKLRDSGYRISWGPGDPSAPAAPLFLEAAYVVPAGRILIEYRCGRDGLGVTLVNQGLPDIPFHVLLAAGPGATLTEHIPDWLRNRGEAVRK